MIRTGSNIYDKTSVANMMTNSPNSDSKLKNHLDG